MQILQIIKAWTMRLHNILKLKLLGMTTLKSSFHIKKGQQKPPNKASTVFNEQPLEHLPQNNSFSANTAEFNWIKKPPSKNNTLNHTNSEDGNNNQSGTGNVQSESEEDSQKYQFESPVKPSAVFEISRFSCNEAKFLRKRILESLIRQEKGSEGSSPFKGLIKEVPSPVYEQENASRFLRMYNIPVARVKVRRGPGRPRLNHERFRDLNANYNSAQYQSYSARNQIGIQKALNNISGKNLQSPCYNSTEQQTIETAPAGQGSNNSICQAKDQIKSAIVDMLELPNFPSVSWVKYNPSDMQQGFSPDSRLKHLLYGKTGEQIKENLKRLQREQLHAIKQKASGKNCNKYSEKITQQFVSQYQEWLQKVEFQDQNQSTQSMNTEIACNQCPKGELVGPQKDEEEPLISKVARMDKQAFDQLKETGRNTIEVLYSDNGFQNHQSERKSYQRQEVVYNSSLSPGIKQKRKGRYGRRRGARRDMFITLEEELSPADGTNNPDNADDYQFFDSISEK